MNVAQQLVQASNETVFAEEIETWLAIRPIVQPALPIVWTPHNGTCSAGIAVENPEHLAALVSSLSRVGAFGNVRTQTRARARWGQTMHHSDHWIVEVHDGTAADWAQRVYRGGPGEFSKTDTADPLSTGKFRPMRAALVLWAWMHGALPEGYSRTLRHIDRDYRRRYGLPEAEGF